MNPYLELTEKSKGLLLKLQENETLSLIENEKTLILKEQFLMLILFLFILAYLFFSLYGLRKKPIKKPQVDLAGSIQRLSQLEQQEDQSNFLNTSQSLIHTMLKDKFLIHEESASEIDLLKALHSKELLPIQNQGEEAIFLLGKGRYGNMKLEKSELKKVLDFVKGLYSLKLVGK